MSKNVKPENMPWVIPYLMVIDGQKSLDFYKAAFGFTEMDVFRQENGKIQHAELKYKDQVIMFSSEGSFGCTLQAPGSIKVESPMSLYVYVKDVDAFFQHAQSQGATVIEEPNDAFWGDRVCKLADPSGYHWCFATKIEKE